MTSTNIMRRLLCVMVSMAIAGCFALFSQVAPAYAATSYGEVSVIVKQDFADAQKALKLVNKERKKAGLGKLKMDKALTKGSILRAAEVAIYVPWSSPHLRPNGKRATTVNSRFVYECCAEGQEDPEEVVEDWMDSPSHRAGILLKSAKSVGIACVYVYHKRIWVLNFSNTKAKSVQKSKKTVTYVKKVKAKSAYLKKKLFNLYCYETPIEGTTHQADIGYSSKYNVFSAPISLKTFTWKSSDPSIATVSKDGLVTAKAPGKVTITATMKKNPKIVLKTTIEVLQDIWSSDYYESLSDDVNLAAARAA